MQVLRSIKRRLPFGQRPGETVREQASLVRFLQRWRRARRADAAGDFQTGDAAVGRGIIFRIRIRRALARGEERRGGPGVLGTSAVRTGAIFQRHPAFDALVEQFNVASGHGCVVDRAGDGHRVPVDVAHVDGPRPVGLITRFDQRVASAQGFAHRDPSGPADGEGVAHGGGDAGRLWVSVRGGTTIIGADGD